MQASQGLTWFQVILPQPFGQNMSVGSSRLPAPGTDQPMSSTLASGSDLQSNERMQKIDVLAGWGI